MSLVSSVGSSPSRGSGRKRKRENSVQLGDREREDIAALMNNAAITNEHPSVANVLRSLMETQDTFQKPMVCYAKILSINLIYLDQSRN